MDVIRCPECGGRSYHMARDDVPESNERERIPCERCAGTGLAPAIECKACKGNPYRACKECGALYLHCKKCNGQGKVPA